MEPRPKKAWKAKYAITPFTNEVDEITLRALAELCPEKKVALHFSCGKDSIAAWITLKENGYEVVPVFKEAIPGMQFINDTITAYEKYFGTEVSKVSSREQFLDLHFWYGKTSSLQTIDTKAELIAKGALKKDIDDQILAVTGCNIAIVGTKASDSLNRRTNFIMSGPFNSTKRTFALTWRLAKNAPLEIMINHNCPIPKFYLWLARSPEFMFDIEYYFIKKYYPSDFERLLELFPDVDVRVKNFEFSDKPRMLMPDKRVLKAKEDGSIFV
jgi:hypothetical protein